MSNDRGLLRRLIGAVRIRQVIDQLRHRLSFVPGLYVIGAVLVAQGSLFVDSRIEAESIPAFFETTVESARAVFSTIAGGLITAITLVLSMMLVAVQLASSQFSPRTLRDWLGDGVLKHTIGLTLGTAVFSLLALRSTRSFDENGAGVVPNLSVAVAVVLALVALFAVVRSVDHITHSLRIGSIARRVARETIDVIEANAALRQGQEPTLVPATSGSTPTIDDAGFAAGQSVSAIEAPTSGWVQQIEIDELLATLPEGSTGRVVVPLGGFVPSHSPLMWVSPELSDDDPVRRRLLDAFALGDTRTMQQDVAFGIMQLTDIAVRAVSPGVNDPNTAADIVVHLGDVMLALWAKPEEEPVLQRDGRTLVHRRTRHGDHLSRAFDPIRRFARADAHVLTVVASTLRSIDAETARRDLPGPSEPIVSMLADLQAQAHVSSWSADERQRFDEAVAG